MVRHADAAVVLTTDVEVNGNRERELRNKFGLPMTSGSNSTSLNGMPQLGNFDWREVGTSNPRPQYP